eukprot:GFUD01073156.1.p1 GENE.GFUD01073156.1~~GFUD01073156.1.p1  ORF type:complete len:244 (+),score=35.31 GFUD01073156.1:73-804(+)
MGWIKLVVASAVGIYSYRSVSRVNQLVRQVAVPSQSLLEYKDAYKITLPPRFKLLKNTGSLEELYVQEFARSFFTCKIFNAFERPLLTVGLKRALDKDALTNDEVLKYKAFKFKVRDKVLVWKVISREHNEILMKWEVGNLSGTTWFYIPSDENVLVFGSSFLVPKENYGEEKLYKSEPKKLYIEAARTLPDELPTKAKIKSTLVKAVFSVVTPIHKLYSKYLLLSTHNKIVNEKLLPKGRPE